MAKKKTASERIRAYVESHFKASHDFPRVSAVASALKMTIENVEEAVGDDPDEELFLTGYNLVSDPKKELGDLYVETYGHDTLERAARRRMTIESIRRGGGMVGR